MYAVRISYQTQPLPDMAYYFKYPLAQFVLLSSMVYLTQINTLLGISLLMAYLFTIVRINGKAAVTASESFKIIGPSDKPAPNEVEVCLEESYVDVPPDNDSLVEKPMVTSDNDAPTTAHPKNVCDNCPTTPPGEPPFQCNPEFVPPCWRCLSKN